MAENANTRAGKLVHPRLPDELHAQVKAYADEHHRSITNAVIYLIERGLQAERGITPTPGDLHLR